MKKWIALFLCVFLLLSLTACGAESKLVGYARTCWEDISNPSIHPDRIYVIQYTSRSALSDELPDTDIFDDIPARGYAFIFHTWGITDGEAFMDNYTYFLNEEGELEFSFDYEENLRLYERNYSNFSIYNTEAGRVAVEYLSNCNYFGGMANYAYTETTLEGEPEKNVWYVFSEEQFNKVIK